MRKRKSTGVRLLTELIGISYYFLIKIFDFNQEGIA